MSEEGRGAKQALKEFLERLRSLRWRGVVVAHHQSHAEAALEVLRLIAPKPSSCVAVADSSTRDRLRGYCGMLVSPARYQEVLGSEAEIALVGVQGLLRPNILAAAAETVVEGGALVITAGPPDTWDPGPPGGRGLYREYLAGTIRSSKSHLVVDLAVDRVLSTAMPSEPAPPRRTPGIEAPRGVPRPLAGLAATQGQLEALAAAARLLRGRGRTLLVLGDRGRGKSYLLGLAVALAVHLRQAGRVHVVAPHPAGVASLFRGLITGLEALGYADLLRRRLDDGWVERVWGPWFHVSYQPPDSAEPAPLLVVDEAAAVGVARVRRLSWRSGRLFMASTIHGYEGSGRALLGLLLPDLPRPIVRVELGEPIRYRDGDPLEQWVREAFYLDAEPPDYPDLEITETRCRIVPPEAAVSPTPYSRGLIGILAQAHYRFEPDYILLVLESRNHRILALEAGGLPVAAADIAVEEPAAEEAARLGLKALSVHSPGAASLRGVRVVRIAVAPRLQRRGLGLEMLGCIEREAVGLGADVVTALFSRHEVIGFWSRAGYRIVYISPRYNRATGEKNVAVAKGLTKAGRMAVEEASSSFRVRLLFSLQSIYRDVAAERVPVIVESTAPSPLTPVAITPDMERRLLLFMDGTVDLEQAFDAVWAAAVNCLSRRDFAEAGVEGADAVALTARILQGKPLNEVAYILGTSMREAHALASSAARKLLEACRPGTTI